MGTWAAAACVLCLRLGPTETRRPPWASFTALLSTTVASSVTTSVLWLLASSRSMVTIRSMLWLPERRRRRSSMVATSSAWITLEERARTWRIGETSFKDE